MELKITLPEWAATHIQLQVSEGEYESAEDFVLDLIEQSRPIEVTDRMAELIREGLESGEGIEVNETYWQRFDERLKNEMERRRSA